MPPKTTESASPLPAADAAAIESEAGYTHIRVRPTNRDRLQRLGTLLGTNSSDETVRILLDLYEVNSGAFAPTDIKDMSALLQQLLMMLAAVNATHMQILEIIRAEHRGVYASAREIAAELDRELARVRALKFPAN